MFDSLIFSLGIESLELSVEEVTTLDVILLSFVSSPMLLFLLLLDTFDVFASFPNDGEFRTTDAGFGLTIQFPLDVA